MTTSDGRERGRLREDCLPLLLELRRLGENYFSDMPAIPDALSEFTRSVTELSMLPQTQDECVSMANLCRTCRQATATAPDSDYPYCGQCLRVIMPSLASLQSFKEGFGTDDL